MKRRPIEHIIRDVGLIIISIGLVIYLGRSGLITALVNHIGPGIYLTSFLAGLFFTSMFTTAPAILVLIKLASLMPWWQVSLLGACGAVVGNALMYSFIKDDLVGDIEYLVHLAPHKRLTTMVHSRLFHWLTPFLGMLLIASPLPDEFGVAMLGISRLRPIYFLCASFIFNFIGILLIVWATSLH